jgi:tRNA(fMet)-specific endonuclease VapC
VEKTLLDTDTFSEVLKGRNRTVAERAIAYRSVFGHLTVSSVTKLEIVRGLVWRKRWKQLQDALAVFAVEEVLPFTSQTAEIAGRIDGELQRLGKTIDRFDPMIAATAIEHDMLLATGNTDHFVCVIDAGFPLRIENWRS